MKKNFLFLGILVSILCGQLSHADSELHYSDVVSPGGCRCRLQVDLLKTKKVLYDIMFGTAYLKEQNQFNYPNTISALRACKDEVAQMDVCR